MPADPQERAVVDQLAAACNLQAGLNRVRDPQGTTRMLLATTLDVAVPIWQARLRDQHARAVELGWDGDAHLRQRAHACADRLCAAGEYVMYRGNQPGLNRDAFNALAEGLAALSFAPGGVHFQGMHWEAPWPGQEAAR